MPHATPHRVIEPRVLYFGTPVVLISTLNADGSANLAPMSSAWWVSTSCMLGLDATSQTTVNLRRSGELVLNLASSDQVISVDRLATLTGTPAVPPHKSAKGYTYVADKFGVAGLTEAPSEVVAPPRVAECPINLEASVEQIHAFEGVGSGVLAIEARVRRVHVDPAIMVAGSERHIDPERWDPLIMKFTHLYGGGSNLRDSRLADAWNIPRVAGSPTWGSPVHHDGARRSS